MEGPKLAVLVTGGSAGIGEAIALKYAAMGYKVAITGRDEDRLNKVLKSMVAAAPGPEDKSRFVTLRADFEDPKQVEPIVGKTVERFGKLDIVINNAGYSGKRREITDADFFEDFQKILQVNLLAATRIAQLSITHLRETKGVLINISSVADRLAVPTISYSVSKAGLSMMTKAMANAVAGTGVRVVGIAPGPVATNFAKGIEKYGPLTCLNRSGRSEEVADLIAFLTSDKASFIHGTIVDIDGGILVKVGSVTHKVRKQIQEGAKGSS